MCVLTFWLVGRALALRYNRRRMCTPEIVNAALSGISRRDLLGGMMGATVAAVVGGPSKPTRAIGITHLVDLTHPLTPQFPYIPIKGLTFPFQIETIATLEKNGVYSNKWTLIEHIGTHIDAPSHFVAGQPNLEAVPIRDLIVPIAVIDVREKAAKERDYALTIDDIRAHEKKHGRLPDNAAVCLYSGWETKALDPKDYLGMDSSETMHFPGFAAETCSFLLTERRIAGVGVDTISFDIGADKTYKAHKALFAGGKWGIENIANLSRIPPVGATALIGALKVPGASASPIRLLAAWD